MERSSHSNSSSGSIRSNGDSIEKLKGLRISFPDEEIDDVVEEEEEEEEDYEEEGEQNVEVILGFVEKPKKPWSLLRQYFPSKAGGFPAWLNPTDLPCGSSFLCDMCEQPLQFLLQVYAPISEEESASTFHRTLFVFICVSMSCLLRDQHEQWKRRPEKPARSVKVFRCQLPLNNPFYSNKAPREDGTTKPSGSGIALCNWCGTWRGDKVCTGCKKAHYCSQKHQAMHWRSGHKVDCKKSSLASQIPSSGPINDDTSIVESIKAAGKTQWPEYELIQAPQSEFDVDMSDDSIQANSLVVTKNKVDETMNSLLDSFQGDEDKQCWASFQERIARASEQVLRYCRDDGAKPLWPMSSGRPSKADIPNCNYCGGLLKFEFQIMPQLLYYFGVKNEVDSLDWGTIVVYTCEASCEAGGAYKEEFSWVQLYSQSSKLY